jgi:hypothetical protein
MKTTTMKTTTGKTGALTTSTSTSTKTKTKISDILVLAGNTKLGRQISTFSIPAVLTCPGMTEFCSKACYLLKGKFLLAGLKANYTDKYLRSQAADFANHVITSIRRNVVGIIRIHVSGDFYSPEYVDKWATVARACPAVNFFCYTRSWRKAEILPSLIEFSKLPNVNLWFSEDPDCAGQSPYVPGVRVAFLVKSVEHEALIPEYADLVFRDHAHRKVAIYPGLVKRLGFGKTLVCPHEQGPNRTKDTTADPITCIRCRVCFTPRPARRDQSQNRAY